MSCNNRGNRNWSDVLDLNVIYTGCGFECGGREVKQGDTLAHVISVLQECSGADDIGENSFIPVEGFMLPSPAVVLGYTNFLKSGLYMHPNGNVTIPKGFTGILNWINGQWLLNQLIELPEPAEIDVYTKSEVDAMFQTVDSSIGQLEYQLSNVYTKSEINNLLAPINSGISNIQNRVSYLENNTYSKIEVDSLISGLNQAINSLSNELNSNYYDSSDVDSLISILQGQIDSLSYQLTSEYYPLSGVTELPNPPQLPDGTNMPVAWTWLSPGTNYSVSDSIDTLEAPEGRLSRADWNGSSWSLVDMGELPQIDLADEFGNSASEAATQRLVTEVNDNASKLKEQVITSVNKYDKSKGVPNLFINRTTGELQTSEPSLLSEEISVKPDTTYVLTGRTGDNTGVRFLDNDGNPLKPVGASTFEVSNGVAFVSPSNAEKVQFQVLSPEGGSVESVMFIEGNKSIPYQPYKEIINTSLINFPSTQHLIDRSYMLMAGGVNIFDKNALTVDGYRIRIADGTDHEETGSSMSYPIPVKGDTVYILKGRTNTNTGFRFLDKDGNFLQPLVGTSPSRFSFPENTPRRSPQDAVAAQFVWKNDGVGSLDDIMFYEGNDTSATYQDFVPKIKTDFIGDIPGLLKTGDYAGTGQDLKNDINSNVASIIQISQQVEDVHDIIDNIESILPTKINNSEKGNALGVAPLNSEGKIPAEFVYLENRTLKGDWNPSTNSPTLVNGTGQVNNYYIASQDGIVDFGSGDIEFKKGDSVIYSASETWILDAKAASRDISIGLGSSYILGNDTLANALVNGKYTAFKKVQAYPNGEPISADNIDGRLYIMYQGSFWVDYNFFNSGEINIKDYGAICDGVTNDQPIIQKLLNFLYLIGGGTVVLPIGRTRLLDEGLKWPMSNVNMRGQGLGSVLQCDAIKTSNVGLHGIYNTDSMPANGSVWNPVRDCYWENFTIDCSGYHNVGTSYVGRKGMFILGLENCGIERVFVYKSIGTGIGCDFLTKTYIKNCIVMQSGMYIGDGVASEIGQSGIGIGSCSIEDESVVVDGNWCIDNGNYGIFVETQSNPSGIKSKFAKITNNHVIGSRYGIGNRGSGGVMISGNTCYYNSRHGIYLHFGSPANMVFNNDCSFNTLDGIRLEVGYDDNPLSSTIIHDNRCQNNGQYGIYSGVGEPSYNLSIKDNEVFGNGYSGIVLNFNLVNARVVGNAAYNNGQKNISSNRFGMLVRGGKHNVVKDNYIYDNQETKTQTSAMWIEKGREGSTPTIIKDNVLTGYNNGNAYMYAAETSEDDIIQDGNLIVE